MGDGTLSTGSGGSVGGGGGGGISRRNSMTSKQGKFQSSRRGFQRKTLKTSAYYRLMLAMSTTDFIVSCAWFMTTWPIPSDATYEAMDLPPPGNVWGNSGTRQTCTAQAFFIQLGIITPFYNALLSAYYYLTIRREWKEEQFKTKVEYAGHVVTLGWGFGTSLYGLGMKLYNNSRVWCWIAPFNYPVGCGTGVDKFGVPRTGIKCERGTGALMYRWALYYGPLWVMIFLVAMFMSLVYLYVRSLDVKMDKYTRNIRQSAAATAQRRGSGAGGGSEEFSTQPSGRGSITARISSRMSSSIVGRASMRIRAFGWNISDPERSTPGGGSSRSLGGAGGGPTDAATIAEQLKAKKQQRRNERSKAVANQGIFYAGTFCFVWLFGTIARAMQLAGVSAPWWILFCFAMITPSQGFFNFLVYVRPRIIKHFADKKKAQEKRTKSQMAASEASGVLHVSGFDSSLHSDSDGGPSTELSLNSRPRRTSFTSSSGSSVNKKGPATVGVTTEGEAETTTAAETAAVPRRSSKVRFAMLDVEDHADTIEPQSSQDISKELTVTPGSVAVDDTGASTTPNDNTTTDDAAADGDTAVIATTAVVPPKESPPAKKDEEASKNTVEENEDKNSQKVVPSSTTPTAAASTTTAASSASPSV